MTWVKSLIRIIAGVLAVGCLLLGLFVYLVRQPAGSVEQNSFSGQADAARIEGDLRYIVEDCFPRDARHPDNLRKAAEYIDAQFKETGLPSSFQDYSADGTAYHNVVAALGPADGEVWVVGAHYDAYGEKPGADDNASGTAVLVEIARLLAARDAPAVRVVLVAYCTEEPPYFGSENMGSYVHAHRLAEDPERVGGMIGLEMLGYYCEVQPWPVALLDLAYTDRGDFIAVAGRWADRKLARELRRWIDGTAGIDAVSYSGPDPGGLSFSDHRNYWAEGFTAVMITDTAFIRNEHYHTDGDTPETLDYHRMAAIAEGVAGFLHARRPGGDQ